MGLILDSVVILVSLSGITLAIDDCCSISRQRALESFRQDVSTRVNSAVLVLFETSQPYRGRRYYLSKPLGNADINRSQAMCLLIGGYLAEIDDAAEYLFVKSFIRGYSGFFAVYTGGNDEAQEGAWVYRYSGKPVTYLDWTPGQPTNDIDGDCLTYLDRTDWKMDDFRCMYTGNDTRFVCEVPDSRV
ncbi:C-type lectin domain family 17, member A-like [Physella acuta]|uniref:C-type lectin domain family 17, member A-like n=1 Tax=Physella acuta TaxID=109671 RepID=UPI0027DBAC09|nr:C-type lectin domain family 17, member A-like [Physella acuta]